MRAIHKGRRLHRLIVAPLLLAVALLAAPAPSSAGNLVCLTVSYRVLGGQKEYVFDNDCYVSGPFALVSWEDECHTHNTEMGQPTLQVCYAYTISAP